MISRLTSLVDFFLVSMVGNLLILDIDLVSSVHDKQTYFFCGLFLGEYGREPVDFSYRLGQLSTC